MHVNGRRRSWGFDDNASIIDAADRLGINQLVCSIPVTGGRWATPEEVRECNDDVLQTMRQFPDRILGYCFLNPGYGRESLDELERCVVDEGMVGVKLYNQYKINDPVVFPIIERTIELGVPILSHAGRLVDPSDLAEQPLTSHAADFVDAGRRYPEAMIIEGHIAGGGDWEWTLKVLREAPASIFLDTSGTVMDAGMIERCVRDFGDERLLFATDMTMEGGVGKILDAEITEAQREKLFWRNFQAVFDRRRVG
jgi:predicted TIM-barrel fold metal-dependent hydrolase